MPSQMQLACELSKFLAKRARGQYQKKFLIVVDARTSFDVSSLAESGITSLRIYGSNFDWSVLKNLVKIKSLDLYDASKATIDL